jgi:uncharacterized protein (DUF1684 family)
MTTSFQEEWDLWHAGHEQRRADPHGFLAITGLHWLTTYAANRSLFLAPPAADGAVELDFNRATNLPCAYTEFATCPLPPAGNRLAVAVEAGEQIPR